MDEWTANYHYHYQSKSIKRDERNEIPIYLQWSEMCPELGLEVFGVWTVQ